MAEYRYRGCPCCGSSSSSSSRSSSSKSSSSISSSSSGSGSSRSAFPSCESNGQRCTDHASYTVTISTLANNPPFANNCVDVNGTYVMENVSADPSLCQNFACTFLGQGGPSGAPNEYWYAQLAITLSLGVYVYALSFFILNVLTCTNPGGSVLSYSGTASDCNGATVASPTGGFVGLCFGVPATLVIS